MDRGIQPNRVSQPTGGVARVMSDIIELVELQWQLWSVDSQEAKRRAVKASIMLVIGLVVAAAALLAGVIGLGWLLHEQTDWSLGLSFLLIAGLCVILAALTGWISMRQLSQANASIAESKREFNENLRWIKAVLLKPNTSPRNQLRHADFPPDLVSAEESRFQQMYQ